MKSAYSEADDSETGKYCSSKVGLIKNYIYTRGTPLETLWAVNEFPSVTFLNIYSSH